MRRLLIVLAVLSTSCGPALSTPVASPQFALYQYQVVLPTKALAPNEQLHLVFEPRLAVEEQGNGQPVLARSVSGIAELQLCVALFGPWETVQALKTAISASGIQPSCPPRGAVTASETLRTTSNSGARLATDVIVPSAPGFYDVHQIVISSAGGATSATAAGGIIEVRNRE